MCKTIQRIKLKIALKKTLKNVYFKYFSHRMNKTNLRRGCDPIFDKNILNSSFRMSNDFFVSFASLHQ